jgi:hypothetical protein
MGATVQEALLLLASSDPHESPSAYLFKPARRTQVATCVHTALMQWQGQEGRSELERVLRHLYAVHAEMITEGIVDAKLISVDAAAKGGLLGEANAGANMHCRASTKPS